MPQITLRGMDPEVEKEIRRMAREGEKSLNRVILDMIYAYKGLGKGKKKTSADSLRRLAGGWSERDADEFVEAIRSCQQIDEDMWK